MIYPQTLKRSPKRPTLRRRAEALRKEMEKPSDQRRDAATVVNEVMEGRRPGYRRLGGFRLVRDARKYRQ